MFINFGNKTKKIQTSQQQNVITGPFLVYFKIYLPEYSFIA